jgi:hypothetical protein
MNAVLKHFGKYTSGQLQMISYGMQNTLALNMAQQLAVSAA